MSGKLAELAANRISRVGVYGAGLHTRRLADVLAASPVPVVAVLDDDPGKVGQDCAGLPIMSPVQARERGIEAVVISSDQYEQEIWDKCSALADRGIVVHRLYDEGRPLTHYELGWDRYARHWDGRALRYNWSQVERRYVPASDQAEIEHPGDEWGRKRQVFEQQLKRLITPEATVLEIGPGSGRITELVLPHCRELHVIEISSEMVEALRRRLGAPTNLHVHKITDVDVSMFADDTFDAAYSIGVFVHLCLEDVYRYFRDLRRVIRPSGRLFIEAASDLDRPQHWHQFLRKVGEFDAGSRNDPTRFHFTCGSILKKFADETGWEMEYSDGIWLRSTKQ